jgi:branched-chain amino acid transport system permease protein
MHYFLVILTSGLLAGIMYAMVAIGFVLIYKASGVFNFAQGSLVLFAALSFVTLTEHGLPFWLAFLVTSLVMVFAAVVIERLVLRPLVDRSPLTLFMATLGLSFVIEGLAQLLMGTDVHQLDLGIDDVPTDFLGLELSQFDLFASGFRCAAWRMTPWRRSLSVFDSRQSGAWYGASRGWSHWWPDCCGVRGKACSFR